jgi:hypothetical protein
MFAAALTRNRWLLTLPAIALALGACGDGGLGAPSSRAAASGTGRTSPLGAAQGVLANVGSYRFTMTLAGGTFDVMLEMLGDASPSAGAPFTARGIIRNTPEVAADLAIPGLRIVEIGGYDYLDLGGRGSFDRIPITDTRLADRFSPATMFPLFVNASTVAGFEKTGSETRNGVVADHYRATKAALAKLGSIAAIADATWTADVWLARDGGCPVGLAVIGRTVTAGIAYEVVFDITDIDAVTNGVVAPDHVTGA